MVVFKLPFAAVSASMTCCEEEVANAYSEFMKCCNRSNFVSVVSIGTDSETNAVDKFDSVEATPTKPCAFNDMPPPLETCTIMLLNIELSDDLM